METHGEMLSRILAEFTNEELLRVLMFRTGYSEAAKISRRLVPHVEATVAIGNDYTASIVMPVDAHKELIRRID